MLSIQSFFSTAAELHSFAADVKASTAQPADLCFIFAQFSLLAELSTQQQLLSTAKKWMGGSSCLGVGSDQGLDVQQGSVTLLQIHDAEGAYGIAAGALTASHAQQQASMLVQQAMTDADRTAQTPELVWCFQTPGQEEAVLAGIRDVVGPHVPIFGGSAADDALTGDWRLFDGHTCAADMIVIAVLYPSAPISGYFSAGYTLTPSSGMVTAASMREIIEIDHKPAAEVYLNWSQLPIVRSDTQQMILAESALHPIGRVINQVEGIPLTLLSHPAYITETGRIGLFTEISAGDQIWLLRGDAMQLERRAAQVVAVSRDAMAEHDASPAGALIVFCGGCMLSMQHKMADVRQAIAQEIPGLPFSIVFTYGEQGCFVDGQSRHGNLMISAVLFGR